MPDSPEISPEACALAADLIQKGRLSMRQLQQGFEWCARNKEPLMNFIDRFCITPAGDDDIEDIAPSGEQQRRFVRHDTQRAMWIEVDQKLVEVNALNVSRGGLAFKCRWALPRDAELRLGAEQQVVAVVRYCVDNGDGTATSGAEFVPETVDDLQAIEELLVSLKSQVLG